MKLKKYRYFFVAQRHEIQTQVWGYSNHINNISQWIDIAQSDSETELQDSLLKYKDHKTRIVKRRVPILPDWLVQENLKTSANFKRGLR